VKREGQRAREKRHHRGKKSSRFLGGRGKGLFEQRGCGRGGRSKKMPLGGKQGYKQEGSEQTFNAIDKIPRGKRKI